MKFVPLFIVLLLIVGCGGPVKRCLVSPLAGTVSVDGKPVAGAKVTRKYYSHWYNEHVETVTHTDAKGYFEFAGVWKSAAVDVMHQPVIEEQVVVEHNSTNYTVLDVTKMNYDSFGELSDIPDHDKAHLSKQDGKLCLKYDLDVDRVPIGQSR